MNAQDDGPSPGYVGSDDEDIDDGYDMQPESDIHDAGFTGKLFASGSRSQNDADAREVPRVANHNISSMIDEDSEDDLEGANGTMNVCSFSKCRYSGDRKYTVSVEITALDTTKRPAT